MATILVVDDNAINRAFLVTLLGHDEHHVIEAADGIGGLKMMAKSRPDLVISDILMPNMGGHEFVTRIRADATIIDTPVIFLTAGYHEAEALVIARACGVTKVLTKPAEPAVILRMINEILELGDRPVALPPLTLPPSEGSRFSTVDSQVAEYLVELESSASLIARLIAVPTIRDTATNERIDVSNRLTASLANLQATGVRLSALVNISREVTAEAHASSETIAGFAPQIGLLPAFGTTILAPVTTQRVSHERINFQQRLAKALQFAGYPHDSPTQLAREFNSRFAGRPVTIHAARKWLVGESIPTQDKLRILAHWLGVTAEWLRFGDTEQPAGGPEANLQSPSAEEAKLLAELMELDPYHRRLAHDFVSMLAQKSQQESGARRGSRPRLKADPIKQD